MASDPSTRAAAHRQARVLVAIGELDEAEHLLAALLEHHPDDEDALAHYAQLKHRRGELTVAIGSFRELVRRAALTEERLSPRVAQETARWLALAEAYERTGTRPHLEAAAHVHRTIAHSPAVQATSDGHLARIYRRLGDERRSRWHEHRHLERTQARAHRASTEEIVSYAAEAHLPLAALRTAVERNALEQTFGSGDPPAGRPHALSLALLGQLDAASAAFSKSDEPLDLLYRAEVAREQGDEAAALRSVLSAIEAQLRTGVALSTWSVGMLVDLHASAPSPASEQALCDAAWLAPLEAALERRIAVKPDDPAAWRQLATLHAPRDPESAEKLFARARRIAPNESETGDVGRVLSAAVHGVDGRPRGLLHELWATRERVSVGGGHLPRENVFGNLTDEMARDVRNVFYAVREWARVRLPHRALDLDAYRYTFKATKDDETSGGRSAGLASALVFLSVFIQRPLPRRLAASGTLVADSHRSLVVGRVTDLQHKVLAAYEARLSALLLPAGNRRDVELSAAVPRTVESELVRYVATFDDAARLAFGDELYE